MRCSLDKIGNTILFFQIDVQYEVEGENFPNSEGKCRIKVQLGSEEYYGGGNTLVEAKQAAAMQVCYTIIFLKIQTIF